MAAPVFCLSEQSDPCAAQSSAGTKDTLPVLLRRAALLPPEAGREIALGGKSAFQSDLRDAEAGFG